MQKKSLLVALFCGALCLTGCLKNEESASVALVRGAKAEELKSLAALNNAKAAAEAVYAQAELTVANAEAKLREAQANLVNAQAETEKVRAELLKVRVALAEVQVEEEKVRLQMLEADLEKKLAEVEAAVAMAEAEKQGWINVLNHAIADAERQAIADAQAILTAEEALANYVLTLEKDHADSALVASEKYFVALDSVQALQAYLLQIKAEKALVEAGALEVRDAIHYAMDRIDEEIAEKEALVAKLKEYQTLTPEQAEEALKAARTALNDAYNKYKDALAIQEAAVKAQTTIEAKKADFNNESYGWPSYGSKWYDDFKKNIQEHFGWYGTNDPRNARNCIYDEVHTLDVTFGEGETAVTRTVKKVGGIVVWDKETQQPKFIPFWHNEAVFDGDPTRYPEVYVSGEENGKPTDYVEIQSKLIAPATIYYDNIKEALDTVVAIEERKTARAIAVLETEFDKDTADVNKEIAQKNAWIAVHKDYVEARKAKVTAAEEAFIAELGKVEGYRTAKKAAWKAFEDYMVVKTDVSRKYFMNRLTADTTYQRAVRDTLNALTNRDAAATAFAGIVEAFIEEDGDFETFIKAEGAYNSVAQYKESAAAIELKDKIDNDPRFNEEFAKALLAGSEAEPVGGYPTDDYLSTTSVPNWIIKGTSIEGGSAQDSLLTWEYNLELADKKLYIAAQDLVRYPEGTPGYSGDQGTKAKYDAAKATRDGYKTQLRTAVTGVEDKYNAAKNYHAGLVSTYNESIHASELAVAEKAYNPNFNNNEITKLVTFPTTAMPEAPFGIKRNQVSYDREKEAWYVTDGGKKVYAGTAQEAFLDAVQVAVNAQRQKTRTENALSRAMTRFNYAEGALLKADEDLMEQLGARIPRNLNPKERAEYIKENIGEYVDTEAEGLYQAYLDIEPDANVNRARRALVNAYSYNPDEVNELELNRRGRKTDPDEEEYSSAKTAQFGWLRSSYMVDSKATMINLDDDLEDYYKIGERMPIAVFFDDILYEGFLTPIVGVPGRLPDGISFDVVSGDMLVSGDDDPSSGEEDERTPVVKDGKLVPLYLQSYQAQVKRSELYRDVILPYILADDKNQENQALTTTKNKIAGFLSDVNEYKTYEHDYLNWVDERMAAQDAVNKAAIDVFKAKLVKDFAQTLYDAAKIVANEGMWVYDPDKSIYKQVYGNKPEDPKIRSDKFTWITINEEIARLEGATDKLHEILGELIVYAVHNGDVPKFIKDKKGLEFEELGKLGISTESIAGLNIAKKLLQEALTTGKVALQVVLDAFDEQIDVIEEKIALYTKLAETYKAVMNAYLGIVPNDESETGPLDGEGEGDDEE